MSRKLILRWSFGNQDTTKLSNYQDNEKLLNMLWLTKLSIISFQKWFPSAKFMLFYNGLDFANFVSTIESIPPEFLHEVIYIDQLKELSLNAIQNKYHFFPMGVWWKWVPFRYDKDYDEISIDTDILCINEPKNLISWLNGQQPLLIAPERFDKILVNTCGDVWNHEVLVGKKPLNCGIVGHRNGFDFSDRFYEISKIIKLGSSNNSFFINEQGVINIWIYSLELEGVDHFTLDFNLNAWVRDFVYFLKNNITVETIHATTWHKKIIYGMKSIFEDKIVHDRYKNNQEFLLAISSNIGILDAWSQFVIKKQITSNDLKEFHLVNG